MADFIFNSNSTIKALKNRILLIMNPKSIPHLSNTEFGLKTIFMPIIWI